MSPRDRSFAVGDIVQMRFRGSDTRHADHDKVWGRIHSQSPFDMDEAYYVDVMGTSVRCFPDEMVPLPPQDFKIGDTVTLFLDPKDRCYPTHNGLIGVIETEEDFDVFRVRFDAASAAHISAEEMAILPQKEDPSVLFNIGDEVVINLPSYAANANLFNGRTGIIDRVNNAESCNFHVQIDPDGTLGLWLRAENLLPAPVPAVNAAELGFRYSLDLNQREYVELMQLVMQHGLTNEGGYKLSGPTVKTISDPDVYHLSK